MEYISFEMYFWATNTFLHTLPVTKVDYVCSSVDVFYILISFLFILLDHWCILFYLWHLPLVISFPNAYDLSFLDIICTSSLAHRHAYSCIHALAKAVQFYMLFKVLISVPIFINIYFQLHVYNFVVPCFLFCFYQLRSCHNPPPPDLPHNIKKDLTGLNFLVFYIFNRAIENISKLLCIKLDNLKD